MYLCIKQTGYVSIYLAHLPIPGSTILCHLEMACYSPDEYSLSDLLINTIELVTHTKKNCYCTLLKITKKDTKDIFGTSDHS